jgi:hypothetical protein
VSPLELADRLFPTDQVFCWWMPPRPPHMALVDHQRLTRPCGAETAHPSGLCSQHQAVTP